MANTSLRSTSSLLSIIPKRYASSASANAAQPKSSAQRLPAEPLKITKLSNGVVVASIENHSPLTRIAAVVNGSARDENSHEQGAAHALRVYSSLATKNFSSLGLSRHLDYLGADFSVSSSREQTTYLLETTRNQRALRRSMKIVGDVVSNPEFRHWEIKEAHERFDLDLSIYEERPELRISDLLHQAAFRNGLCRSLYAPAFNVHHLSSDVLEGFHKKLFTPSRLQIVGLGINHADLVHLAENFQLPKDSGYKRDKSKYLGSELRQETTDDLVHVALAAEGASLNSKEALVAQIAASAFGDVSIRVPHSVGISRLSKVVNPLAAEPAAVKAFSLNYSDTGLFGIQVVANYKDIAKVVRGVHANLVSAAKSGLSNEEIAAAKKRCQANLAISMESGSRVVEDLGTSAESYQTLDELVKALDAVNANDVNTFVKRVGSSKLSMASIGKLSELPRLDEF